MTYIEHLLLSGYLSRVFFIASCKAVLHAIFPFLYVKSSTEYVEYIQELLKNAGCRES